MDSIASPTRETPATASRACRILLVDGQQICPATRPTGVRVAQSVTTITASSLLPYNMEKESS